MKKIKTVSAREILSSGGSPSLEVMVELEDKSIGIASVPYGASAGSFEAHVLFDGDKTRYKGKGMLNAVKNINKEIATNLIGENAEEQEKIDQSMIKLDGTPNKERLGANAILGVSMAVAKASAKSHNMPLYRYIREVFDLKISEYFLPNPMMVAIEGGKHAHDSTDFQEYLISPIGNDSVSENVRRGIEVYFKLKEVIKRAGYSTNVGNEGAFAPAGVKTNEEPIKMIMEAIGMSGLEIGKEVGISLDPAASEIFENGKYNLSVEGKKYSSKELIDYFDKWFEKYPILTAEDLLDESDWDNWEVLNKIGKKHDIKIVGDDLTVTNVEKLERAINSDCIGAILIKLNQIGSLSETVKTCVLARKNGLITIPSHRGGGETNDSSMVDLAVALNSSFIKVGPTRGERVSKYNRLMEIELELGKKAQPIGTKYKEVL